jgi:hypothetical protein
MGADPETITEAELAEALGRRHPDKPREGAEFLACVLFADIEASRTAEANAAPLAAESPRPPSPEPDTAAMGSGEGDWRDQDEASSPEPHMNLLEMAWGVIANAGWDDCAKTPGWQEAAVRWRDDYHRWLDLHLRPGGYQTWEQLAVGVTRERDALFAEVAQLRRDVRDFKACEPVTAIPAFASDEDGWRERAEAAERKLAEVRNDAHRYLVAVYGPNYVYKAPETFGNLVERWIWAVAAEVPEMAHASIADIERRCAERDSCQCGSEGEECRG